MSINDEQQTTVVPDAAQTAYVASAWSREGDDATYSSLTKMTRIRSQKVGIAL